MPNVATTTTDEQQAAVAEAEAIMAEGVAVDVLDRALEQYLARQDRAEHPDGTFDKKSRWYPDDTERQGCCASVRSPSAAWPYSLMKHCRGVEHVAALHDVDVSALRKAARRARPPKRAGGDRYFKAVAVATDGRLLSIYDGETEYRLGETLVERVGTDHGGGYYAYPSREAAEQAGVPESSVQYDAPRAIIRVRAEGQYIRYDDGKMAFSRITPLEIVAMPTVTVLEVAS